jgi:hypothetical protein
MRRGLVAFQLTGSLLAILCALGLAVALGGCGSTAVDWQIKTPIAASSGDLWRSDLRTLALLSGLAMPLSRTEENAIIAHAIAEHEKRNP